MFKNILLLVAGLLLPAAIVFAQEVKPDSSAAPKPTAKQEIKPQIEEMKLKLNESGSHFLKWTFLNQTWVRFNESNPGTTVAGEAANQTVDFGLRRTRIQFFGQLTDHVFFYTQFGQNNFNFLSQNGGNRKLQAFFHDALGEYKVWKDNDHLKFGGGLTITNGLSRFSQPSVGTIMTLDVPVFAQATVDQTDEFSRKLSIYARGQVGKVDYRLVVSDPFPITTNGATAPIPSATSATFASVGHHKQYQGFLIYNFLDKETHTTPYMTGTYLGKKKILNLEAGFISQKNATWTRASGDLNADTVYHAMNLWSVAMFYDAPINAEKGTALSAYAGYFDYDFGPNYLRYNGIMNPANGIKNGPAANSQGNAFPMFGTGNIIYAQIGYLMKRDLLGSDHGTLMPYASIMYANYDRLEDPMAVWDVGVNWLIKGHTSKLSLDYQNRPYYKSGTEGLVKDGTKGQVVLQYQVSF
jgi:hypothetical protein